MIAQEGFDIMTEGYKIHLYLDDRRLAPKERKRLRESEISTGYRVHVRSPDGERLHCIDDLFILSPHRFSCPHVTLSTPEGYVSPWAVSKVGSMRLPEGVSRYEMLRRVSGQPFNHLDVREEAEGITHLDPFILRVEDLASAGVIDGNNISFGRCLFGTVIGGKLVRRNNPDYVDMSLLLTALHEFDHGYEIKRGLGIRSSGWIPMETAEHFAIRARYEARDLVRKVLPAIRLLKRGYRAGKPVLFDPRTGSAEFTDAPAKHFETQIAAAREERPNMPSDEELAAFKEYMEFFEQHRGLGPEALEDALHSTEYYALQDRFEASRRRHGNWRDT